MALQKVTTLFLLTLVATALGKEWLEHLKGSSIASED